MPDQIAVTALPETNAGPAGRNASSEIRLSFGLFYVVLRWGQERRSADRLEAERKIYPVLTATHMPVLAALWGAIFLCAYYLLVAGLEGLTYLFS